MTSSSLNHHGQQRSKNARATNSNVEHHKVAYKVKKCQIKAQLGKTLKTKLLELKPKKQRKSLSIMFLCYGASAC